MKFQRKQLATVLACTFGAGSIAFGVAAQAQQADIKVEVTGSNIKRVEGEGASAVTVITRDQIDKSGATSPIELLQLVSANNSSGQISLANTIGATTFGVQTASLRGLGGGRTLVLIDGKRMSGTGGEVQGVQGVNLSTIPFSAIERVEILKDGASAIYGSDAIGGVINFIMRQDYRGAEGFIQYGAPTRSGGGEQYIASGTVGFGDLSTDRYNAFLTMSYQEQKSLNDTDRNFSNSSFLPGIGLIGISGNTFPAYISTGGIGSPNFPSCNSPQAPEVSDPFFLGNRCYYNPNATPGVESIPQDKLFNFYGSGRFQINRDWQAYVQGTYSHDETRNVIQPVPISNQFAAGDYAPTAAILLPPTSPYYPHDLAQQAGIDGTPLNVRYRSVLTGNRDTTDTNEGGQVVAGVKGNWKDWDWDGSFNYSQSNSKEKLNGGFPLYSQILPLLNSGNVNVFGPNTAAITQQVQATEFNAQTFSGEAKQYGFQGKTSGDIWKLPAGPLSMAVGLEGYRQELTQTPAAVLGTGDVSGYGGNFLPINASRNEWAAFAEWNVPIVKTLEGDVAVRYDHYSDFGGTTNPKVSLRWQPVSTFLLRGSYGTGFIAPSLYQLDDPNTAGVTATGQNDPLRCPPVVPVDQASALDCKTQFAVTFGGNPNLKPEESWQASGGFVWEPVSGASLSVDYFKLNLSNAITNGIPTSTILGNLSQYGYLVTRGPVDPTQPNLPGHITNINQTYINLGNEHIQGIDFDLRYNTPTSSVGTFQFGLASTYYLKYDNQNTDGSYSSQVGNQYGAVTTGVIPRYKQYASVTWNYGPWSTTLGNSYQSGYIDTKTYYNQLSGTYQLRKVSSMSLWDLQASYTGFKNLKLTLGAKNLFDTNPPSTNQQGTFQNGYDPSYYDARARFVYGSVTYTYK